ncbi:HEAT repeat-containing protein 1-like [Scomber japonicus]|uniref:HEAT repeat-containing protein 1-like n=1 Tax=Scomber japonicus TaxID=13676 RepID=UPI002306279F|nr:HEAT repeat-containing protein 1-like [Scomber japonicus]
MPNKLSLQNFFQNLTLPCLSPAQVETLDKPVSQEEVKKAIRAMKTGKSPGSDGFPVEYYKEVIKELSQILGESDTSLLLSLKHPQTSVRVSAVDQLMSIIASGQQQSLDEVFLKEAVSERLKDDSPAVVALKVLEALCDELDAEDVVSSLLSLLHRTDLSHAEQWLPVQTEVVRLLSDPRLVKSDAELLQRVGWKLLPFLVLTAGPNAAQTHLASCIARSSVISRHPLTLNWAQGLDEVMKRSSELDFVGSANQCLVSTALGVLHDESQQQLQASLLQLLRCVQAPSCPSYSAASLLRALSHVNGESVLSSLLPVLERLLEQRDPDTPTLLRSEAQLMQLVLGQFNEASAPLLAKDQNCLDLFVRALRTPTPPHPDVPSCQIIALEQITKSFFSALGDEKVQQKLLSVMFDLLVESRSPLVANTVSSAFKAIAVDGQLVANELAPPEKPKVSVTVQQTRRSKMLQRKPEEGGDAGPVGGAVSWQRVTLILELLQHKKKLKRAQTLVPVLFTLLSRSLETSSADDTNLEYSKQLLLSCLLNICNKLSADGRPVDKDVLDEDRFSVELVVQVIRTSDMPQTHHHALLLLGTVASIFPEKVLHNIMPIFTFMGANIMRLDDAYSFRVIDKTVQMVIPALIQAHSLSDGQSSAHVVAVVTKIMHVFANALPHVPEHRRLPILSQLVTTLGPARFLWVLMLLLFKLHATQAADGDKDAALEPDVDFWISVCGQFEVSEQLSTLISILKFLLQLPDDKDDVKRTVGRRGAKKKEEEEEEKVEELIFSLETHSSKELRHFKFLSVSFMAQLLGSASFIGKVADCGDIVDESLQQLQQGLLEEILRYIHSVARCVEENADKPTAKFWRVLLNKAYDVLNKVNALLPTDTFITVMRGLMGNELASVRRKAMELLNNKLQHRTQWDEQQVTVLLQLIGDLLSIVGKGAGHVTAAQRRDAAQLHQPVCRLTRLVEASSSSSSSSAFTQLTVRLCSLRTTLATKLPPRVLLPTLAKCYSAMVQDRKSQLEALMSILKEHITHMEKDQLNFHQSELTAFFLTALDFRAEHCQGDLASTAQVEGSVMDCLIVMVMKLSEVTFRPLFFKLFDWAKSETGSKDRLLTFYRLSDRIAERLKRLITLLYKS